MESKISIIRKIANNMSYFVDENGILKGEWGGFNEDICEEGKIFELYYSKFRKNTWITEKGDFYGFFSCCKYDRVLLLKDNFYLCEKNDRYGIIELDQDYDEFVILDVCYKDIKILNDYEIICESEVGKSFYNIKNRKRSFVYDDIIYNYDRPDDCLVIYKGGFGLIDHQGNELVRPFCKSYRIDSLFNYRSELIYSNDSTNHSVYIDKGKFFGKIDPMDYYICYKSKSSYRNTFDTFYIALNKNFCWGILNKKGEYICSSIYNKILDDGFYIEKSINNRVIHHYCVICVFEDSYNLFDVREGVLIIEKCSSLKVLNVKSFGKIVEEKQYIEYGKNGLRGYITKYGRIISEDEYNSIELLNDCFVVSKNDKYGVLNYSGFELLPCEYDSIVKINGANIIVKKNNIVKEIVRKDYHEDNNISIYEGRHYNRYGGYQGYSDEDIDTIFDGDPSAYWNID